MTISRYRHVLTAIDLIWAAWGVCRMLSIYVFVAKMQDTIEWVYNRNLIRELPDHPFGSSEYDDRVILMGGI